MSNKFTEREKGFEKKFARDEELQLKVQVLLPKKTTHTLILENYYP